MFHSQYYLNEKGNSCCSAIGAFNDEAVRDVMQLPENEEPLYIMPVGQYYHRAEL